MKKDSYYKSKGRQSTFAVLGSSIPLIQKDEVVKVMKADDMFIHVATYPSRYDEDIAFEYAFYRDQFELTFEKVVMDNE